MANNRFLTEDFKAACTAAKPRFEWPTMTQLKQKFLAHHRDNRDQLKSSWLKFIASEDNHDYVKKPALKILKRDVASQLELQSEGDFPLFLSLFAIIYYNSLLTISIHHYSLAANNENSRLEKCKLKANFVGHHRQISNALMAYRNGKRCQRHLFSNGPQGF